MSASIPDLTAASLFDFKGKVALVTGGGTGIGLMMAQGLAANGATVYIGGRRLNKVEESAEKYGPKVSGSIEPVELDISSKDSIHQLANWIESRHKKLDILINNSGQSGPKIPFMKDENAPERSSTHKLGESLFKNESIEDWKDLYGVNVAGTYFVTVGMLHLLDAGSKSDEPFSANVINIASMSGTNKITQAHFAYNASKSAVNHITQMLATEFALKGVKVRVNAIGPGLFPSEMTDNEGGQFDQEALNKGTNSLVDVPSGRGGKAEEIAGTALYLASKAGRYTNGQKIIVDGGYQAVNPASS